MRSKREELFGALGDKFEFIVSEGRAGRKLIRERLAGAVPGSQK